MIYLYSHILETRLSPFVKRMPKSAWLLRTKSPHIKDAVVVHILECANRPTANRNLELKVGFGVRFNADLLNWMFQEFVALPQRNEDDVFSRTSTHISRDADENGSWRLSARREYRSGVNNNGHTEPPACEYALFRGHAHIIRRGRMPKKLTLQTGVIFFGFARVLLDFSQVQSVKTLGNFTHGNVDDGLDGRGIDDGNGAGGGV